MWYKCETEFIYKPKGIMKDKATFHEALRKFFLDNGYLMEKIEGEEEEACFTIEPLPEIIENRKIVLKK